MTELAPVAAQNYAAIRNHLAPSQDEANPSGLIHDFSTTLLKGEQAATAAMTSEVDPHAFVKALAQTELAVEAAVTVRDKVVEAYQEILRMPV